MKVMSLLFVLPFSWFFFQVVSPHKSLLPLVILLLFSSFMLFDMLLPLTIRFSLFFLLLLLSLLSSSKFRKHSGTSPSPLQCLSLHPLFSFQILIFFCVVIVVVFFTSYACWKVTVNFFELFPAASFTCASVASLIFLCCRVHLTTRSLFFISASLSRLSTAHSRCDEFLLPFFHFIFDLRFNVLVFDVVERSTSTCFTTIWPLTDTCFDVWFKEIGLRRMLCLM